MVTEKEAWKALKTIIDFCMQFTHEECRKLQCPISFWCDEIRVSRPVDWDEEIDFDQTIAEAEEEGDRMSCDRNKCYKQEYNGGSCDECMKDAPHDYCCELECGEHEFCRGCQKAGEKNDR